MDIILNEAVFFPLTELHQLKEFSLKKKTKKKNTPLQFEKTRSSCVLFFNEWRSTFR